MEHRADSGMPPLPPSGAGPRGLGNALVVEDEAIVALAIADTLTQAGADEVAVCDTTALALGEMQRLRPSILVLDVHLADRDDGWALAELALAAGPTPPLIVFSTATPESIPPHVAQTGHVLPKPFLSETLTDLVQRHLVRQPGLLGRLRSALSF